MRNNKGKTNKKAVAIICTVLTAAAALAVLIVAGFENRKYSAVPEYSGLYTSSDAEHSIYGRLADISIELSIGGSKEKLVFDDICDWVTAKKQGEGFIYTVSDEKVREYADMLDKKYSNYQSYITFNNVYGEEITVENKSVGWIFDPDHAFSVLRELIEKGESVRLDLTDRSTESNKWWIRTASDYNDAKNEKKLFAEVSIEEQYMWVRKNNEVILEAPVVTGDPGMGNDTPKGAYLVYEKKSPSSLYGPGYETEVAYWIAFNDSIGFHDATWQDSFGGSVYLYNGSHGCVNMPLDAVSELYDIAYIGMPVYVY